MITKTPETESEPEYTRPTRHVIESLDIPDSLSRGIYPGACEYQEETFVQKISPCGCETNISVDNDDFLSISSESKTNVQHHQCQKPATQHNAQSTSNENLEKKLTEDDCCSKIVTSISINEIGNSAAVQNSSKYSFKLKGNDITTSCKSCQASIDIQCLKTLQETRVINKDEGTKPECSPKCSGSLHLQAECRGKALLRPVIPSDTHCCKNKSKTSIEVAVQPKDESCSKHLVSTSVDATKPLESLNQPRSPVTNVEVIPTFGPIKDTTKPLEDERKLQKGVCAVINKKCNFDAKQTSCLNAECPSNKKQCLCRYPPAYSQYFGNCAGVISGNCNCENK